MFTTPLDLRADAPGKWILLRDLIWHTATERYVVPAGFVTDLASIPGALRGILQQNGRSRRAAVLHDFLYRFQPIARAAADKLFLTALAADGVISLGRGLYYLGVRCGGFLPWRRNCKGAPK